MSPLSIVQVEGWQVATGGFDDGLPRVRDIELAEHLGYERPRKMRDLIARLISDGKLNSFEVCTTVGQTTEAGGRPSKEYWLTEAQALKVVAKSETAKADAILDELIRVFLMLRDGHRVQAPHSLASEAVIRHNGVVDLLLKARDFLAPEYIERTVVHSVALLQGSAPVAAQDPLLDVSEYLESRGLTRDELRRKSGQFGKLVKAAYRAAHGEDPKKLPRFINGAERLVSCYTERDRALFDQAFDKLMGTTNVIPLKGGA